MHGGEPSHNVRHRAKYVGVAVPLGATTPGHRTSAGTRTPPSLRRAETGIGETGIGETGIGKTGIGETGIGDCHRMARARDQHVIKTGTK